MKKKIFIFGGLLLLCIVGLLIGCSKANQNSSSNGEETMTQIPEVKDVKDITWGEYEDGETFDPFADIIEDESAESATTTEME